MKKLFLFLFLLLYVSVFAQTDHNTGLESKTIQYLQANYEPIYTDMISCYTFKDSSVTVAVDSGVWTTATNAANDLFTSKAAVGFVNAGDSIVATNACTYASVFWEVSATFSNADVWKGRVVKISGTDTTGMGCATYTGNNKSEIMVSKCVTSVAVGDVFKLQFQNTTDGDDYTVICGRMIIIRHF